MATPASFAFLHGGGQGGWIWDETLAALSPDVRAQVFDLPGCGAKRGVETSRLTVSDVADVLIAELAAAGLENCILTGHSNAGTILPLVAERRPDLVRRYVYLSCIAPPPGRTIREVMGMSQPEAESMEVRLRRMFCNDMDSAEADAFLAKLGHDHWPTLQALNETAWRYDHLREADAIYIICQRDQALPVAWQEEFATRLHVRRRAYIDAGHQAMNTQPHRLAALLLAEAA